MAQEDYAQPGCLFTLNPKPKPEALYSLKTLEPVKTLYSMYVPYIPRIL